MSDESTSACFECKRPLVEIDNRGQRLRGCLSVQHLVVAHGWRGGQAVGGDFAPQGPMQTPSRPEPLMQ
jgi:hypothetical protein